MPKAKRLHLKMPQYQKHKCNLFAFFCYNKFKVIRPLNNNTSVFTCSHFVDFVRKKVNPNKNNTKQKPKHTFNQTWGQFWNKIYKHSSSKVTGTFVQVGQQRASQYLPV